MTNATTAKTTPPTAKQATCKEDGCERKILARKMCSSHYSQWHRTEGGKERTYTCIGCGIEYTTRRKPRGGRTFCTKPCQQLWMRTDEGAQARKVEGYKTYVRTILNTYRQCANCDKEFFVTGALLTCCSDQCAEEWKRKAALDRRPPLRKACEENDHKGILEAIEELANKTKSGCWEWPQLTAYGYPKASIGGKVIAIHRLSLEAKHGAPLGSQSAHHMCANTKCVNPEHLQPVTHRENVAEMITRRAYVDRIAELEEVIKEIAPNHEVLDRVPLK